LNPPALGRLFLWALQWYPSVGRHVAAEHSGGIGIVIVSTLVRQ